jgi:NADP-reducing hydrogenase subunit HndB
MTVVQSRADLARARGEALARQAARRAAARAEIFAGLSTPGLAAGARETLAALHAFIEQEGLEGVVVRQTGSLALDSLEPAVRVILPGQAPVTYARVTPEAARRILREHVTGGRIVADLVVPA